MNIKSGLLTSRTSPCLRKIYLVRCLYWQRRPAMPPDNLYINLSVGIFVSSFITLVDAFYWLTVIIFNIFLFSFQLTDISEHSKMLECDVMPVRTQC